MYSALTLPRASEVRDGQEDKSSTPSPLANPAP